MAPADGTYYLGISGASNSAYNPNVPGSGAASSTGAYQLQLSVTPSSSPGLTLLPPSISSWRWLDALLHRRRPGPPRRYRAIRAGKGAVRRQHQSEHGPVHLDAPFGSGPWRVHFLRQRLDPYGGFDEQPLTIAVVDPNRGSDQTGESLSTALPVFLSENTPTTLAGPYALGNGAYGQQDVDLFRVSLSAGQTLSANVLAAQIGLSSLYSYLRVFDANGNQLAAADNSTDPNTGQPSPDAALTYLVAADGIYYLGVSGAQLLA